MLGAPCPRSTNSWSCACAPCWVMRPCSAGLRFWTIAQSRPVEPAGRIQEEADLACADVAAGSGVLLQVVAGRRPVDSSGSATQFVGDRSRRGVIGGVSATAVAMTPVADPVADYAGLLLAARWGQAPVCDLAIDGAITRRFNAADALSIGRPPEFPFAATGVRRTECARSARPRPTILRLSRGARASSNHNRDAHESRSAARRRPSAHGRGASRATSPASAAIEQPPARTLRGPAVLGRARGPVVPDRRCRARALDAAVATAGRPAATLRAKVDVARWATVAAVSCNEVSSC